MKILKKEMILRHAVRIDKFSDSSIDLYVRCFTVTNKWIEWLKVKERLAVEVKKIVEGNGASFAFPSHINLCGEELMKSAFILFDNIVTLYIWVLILNAVLSWLVAFNILNTSNRFVYAILDLSYRLTDPPLNFIRKYIPNFGSIDISPVILILLL